ncbi:superfamily I DNA/RNA helicase [Listeria seeligeri FSL S4-171]|uniref:AAA domain-containing protein n=1 Tax=Listeria seeligeri TaxID=1640 RepID=UPI0001EB7B84|nr:AAA domain-containing protein [Listeria seeligeri]EFS04442.1 superfamily I DNA/RNA helicase [Listeria seeligeri FSL S4-171]
MKKLELKAMEIIEFWRLIEFLNQKAFPVQSKDERKIQISTPEEINQNKLTVFEEITSQQTIKEKIQANEKLNEQLPITSTNFHILVGRMERKVIIDTLYQKFKDRDTVENNPEKIAMYALKVNAEGKYIKGSLRLSPLLWGMTICCYYPDKLKTKLKLEEYYKTIAIIEAKFFSEDENENEITTDILEDIYNYILKCFVNNYIHANKNNYAVYCNKLIYTCFKNQEEFDKYDETLEDHSELMLGFFQSDFEMVLNKLKIEGANSDFINYVTSLYEEGKQKNLEQNRRNIREDDNLLYNILDPLKTPKGKWPSKYSPVLMQQVAINAYLQNKEKIFSVNGPPGTGKTTLLKEVIAHNVVERAALFAEYKKADDAFETLSFRDGGKRFNSYDKFYSRYYDLKNSNINDFSMLVTSSNNAAVENITKELPDYKELMNGIESEETAEIKSLFDQHKQQSELSFNISRRDKNNKVNRGLVKRKDVYFTLLAHLLKHNNDNVEAKEVLDEWGIISAPLGKRANLANYYYQVMMPIISHKDDTRKLQKDFEIAKRKFKNQYQKVQELQQILHENTKINENKIIKLREIDHESKLIYDKISKQHNKIEYWKREDIKSKHEINQFSPEIKQASFQFEREKSKLISLKAETNVFERRKSEITHEIIKLEDKRKLREILLQKFVKSQRLLEIENLKVELFALSENEKLAIVAERQQSGVISNQIKEINELEQRKSVLENKCIDCQREINLSTHQIHWNRTELIKLKKDAENVELESMQALKNLENNGTVLLDNEFFNKLHEQNVTVQLEAQLSNPWTTKQYDREREKLFYLALQVNKHFVLSSKNVKANLVNLSYLWGFKKNTDEEFCHFSARDRKSSFKALLNTLFLVTPVISTTFASVSRFLADIDEPDSLGQLIIDEAGQATPQMAVGALWRFKKAIVVGDPKQVEPIVTDDIRLLMELFAREELSWYKGKLISVQSFADSLNYIGSYLSSNNQSENQWVGCPLVIHRRCLNPMFTISNKLSYDNTMLFKTAKPKENIKSGLVMSKSMWFSITGSEVGNKNHHVPEQANKAVEIVEEAFRKQNGEADIYIISPFTSVIRGVVREAQKSPILNKYDKVGLDSWLNSHCGTVHKFQGKEAKEVIFLLGCDGTAKGAVNWVNENIVNVAVTRAKYRLYVIGDVAIWKKNHSMLIVQNELEIMNPRAYEPAPTR